MSEGGSLRNKATKGVMWSAVERFSLQGVHFIVNIIMARLLLPADYGVIGMLAILMAISQAFIDSGFSNALIQKKNRTEIDFSTVFYFNILISSFFYVLIYFSAPLIADFYHIPELTLITRVVALGLIFSSFSAIHVVKFTLHTNFKIQAEISLISAVVSGGIGIYMAYTGYGVWALIIQSLFEACFRTLFFYLFLRWKPLKVFSLDSLSGMFRFGSKLLVTNMINSLYRNLYIIVIGRKFSATELGYYTRADQFAMLPSSSLSSVIFRVSFPLLSSIQDDSDRLKQLYRKYIRLSSYIIFPLMFGIIALAKPMIILLLTEKWINVVILLQILCLDWMFDHLSVINSNLLYVKGRSDLSLRLEILKKVISTGVLLISIPFGIVVMCWGRVLCALISVSLNLFYTYSYIGVSYKRQLKDILPSFFLSLSMGGITLFFITDITSVYWQLFVGSGIAIIYYFSISYLFKLLPFKELIKSIKWK